MVSFENGVFTVHSMKESPKLQIDTLFTAIFMGRLKMAGAQTKLKPLAFYRDIV